MQPNYFKIEMKNKEGVVVETRYTKNTLLNSGKAFIEDHALGIANWFVPGVTTTPWSSMTSRFCRVGSSSDTNTGIVGPTTGAPVATGQDWSGVDPEDYKLSNEVGYKEMDSVTRADGMTTANMKATFTNVEIGAGEVTIRELGISLSATAPTAKPQYNYAQRPNAMLIRSVLYATSSGQYIDAPIVRASGEDLTVTHMFGLLDS